MIIFDGDRTAAEQEQLLKQQVAQQSQTQQSLPLKIAAILFVEDQGSQLYTQLKRAAAERVGIAYEVFSFEMAPGVAEVEAKIAELNQDETVTGIIIQKPWRKTWVEVRGIAQDKGDKAIRQAFNSWWRYLASLIALEKDVDGLHPATLAAIQAGTWRQEGRVMPATAAAVLEILQMAMEELKRDLATQQVLILGRSDIMGLPLFYELENQQVNVKLLTQDDLQQRQINGRQLLDGDVVISATGHHHLITGEMIKEGAIVIDVGEPRPDVDQSSVATKAAFLTPVPGGVGPMTVMKLLQNCLRLVDML